NTILKEADLFCPNSVRINFTIYLIHKILELICQFRLDFMFETAIIITVMINKTKVCKGVAK
ncbi:hypothetical protein, partial [Lactiplantibacillus plantarum]|uniref:hypothetical protein n=1 Tax=Lactiplantibacillus plantarum TaxID=1590 RepID=UPI001C9E3AA6